MIYLKIILFLFTLNILTYSQYLDTVITPFGKFRLPIINNGSIEGSTRGRFNGVEYMESVVLFSAGFYISGYADEQLWSNGVFPSNRDQDYLPGVVGSDPNDSTNVIYEIYSSDIDFGKSWQKWKEAVNKGAYFYDGNQDGIYNPIDMNGNGFWDIDEDKPDIIGDYTAWTVYNDGVPADERNFENPSNPQHIEIRQTVFSFNTDTNNVLSNTVFIRYILENKNILSDTLNSIYFGAIMDPDIGDYNDYTGCDSTLNVFYGYDKGKDGVYGIDSPCMLGVLLQGAKVQKPGESAIIKRGPLLGEEHIMNSKILSMKGSVSAVRGPSFPPPQSTEHARYFLEGGKYPNGEPLNVKNFIYGNGDSLGSYVDSVDPKFMFSGDPIKKTGWLNIHGTDWRTSGSTGPFRLIKNQPIEIIIAYIVGRGVTSLNSVTIAKAYAEEVIKFYESNFTEYPVKIKQNKKEQIPDDFYLSQNYPNPFNPSTTIKYSIPLLETLHTTSQPVQLKVYDILGRTTTTIVNERKPPGSYEVVFNAENLSSGIYFYELRSGNFVQTKKMILLR